MRSSRRIAVLAVLVVALAAVVSGTVATAAPTAEVQTIRYATSFGSFGRDGFVFVAIEKGYFRDAGFDVQVVPGLGTDNARLLASGQVDYAGGEIMGTIVGRVVGGFPVKFVAVTSQSTQAAIATLADGGPTSPKGLEGRTLADLPASIVIRLFPFYAKRAGIDLSKVNIVPGTPQTLPSLLATGRVDAIGQFTVGVPTLQKAAGGRKVRTFKYSQYLKGLLGNGIVTTDARVRDNPGEVRRFTRALLRGLNYAMQNPGESGHIMQKYVPIVDPVTAGNELRILKYFVQNKCTRANGVGYIDVQKVKSTASIVRNAFQTKPFAYTDLYSSAFVKTTTCKR
jgi:NitT/TauT family transport system substrate-binding protein